MLCFDKRLNCAEKHAFPEQFLRVTWEAVVLAIVLSLIQIKLFSILFRLCTSYFHQHIKLLASNIA